VLCFYATGRKNRRKEDERKSGKETKIGFKTRLKRPSEGHFLKIGLKKRLHHGNITTPEILKVQKKGFSSYLFKSDHITFYLKLIDFAPYMSNK
jgi:hypothetical protein